MSVQQRKLAITALVVVVLDQISKALAVMHLENSSSVKVLGSLVKFSFARNSGAAFSFATGATFVFTALAFGACIGIIWFSAKISSTAWAIVFGAIFGGAFGNLLDRIFRSPQGFQGHVVDFIEFPNYPIFNLADSAIFCAAIAGIVLTMRGVTITEVQAQK
ncbi:MAG: signal peptidase II [Actinobacteria bacterium]|nr:signal peptidase II [Actinomycetota bacterium]